MLSWLLAVAEGKYSSLPKPMFPTPQTVEQLNQTGSYTPKGEVYNSQPAAVLPNGEFSAKVKLNYQDKAGLYHILICVEIQGRLVEAADLAVEVGR